MAELTKQLQDFKGLKVRLSMCSTPGCAGPTRLVAMLLSQVAPRQLARCQCQVAAWLLMLSLAS